MYRVIEAGQEEAAQFFDRHKNSQSELFQVILKHRRFVFYCAAPDDLKASEGWHFKMKGTAVAHRIYESEARLAVIENPTNHIFRLPCVRLEKAHNVWLIKPGTSALFFFFVNKHKGVEWYTDSIFSYLREAAAQWPGVTIEQNDILINGRKAAGLDTAYSEAQGTLLVTMGITYDATELRQFEPAFDFSKTKYKSFAGFNETGMSEADFDRQLKDFYEALRWL